MNISITLCFFHPQKLAELKRQTIPLKKKLESYLDLMPVIIFITKKKKKKVPLFHLSPRALNDHENTGSMFKDLKSMLRDFPGGPVAKTLCS